MGAVRVLITGAGAPGARGTIYALRHNPEGRDVEIVGTDVNTDVVGRYLVDRFYRVPPAESAEYVPSLIQVCRIEKITLVLPQTTREAQVLASVRDDLVRQGIRVAVSGLHALSIANDKGRLVEAFAKLGLPYPRYRLARSEEELIDAAEALGYPTVPVVVKPPVSSGMRGLRILREDAWDVRRFLGEKPDGVETSLIDLVKVLRRGSQWPTLLVTEYLPGPEYTVDAFRGKDIFVAIPRIRRAIRSGITFIAEIEQRSDLEAYSKQAAEALGLEYAFGFQFKLDAEGVPKVLECNPRIQGTMVASVFAGYNIPWFTVRELMGMPMRREEVRNEAVQGVKFYRYWGGVGVVDDTPLGDI